MVWVSVDIDLLYYIAILLLPFTYYVDQKSKELNFLVSSNTVLPAVLLFIQFYYRLIRLAINCVDS